MNTATSHIGGIRDWVSGLGVEESSRKSVVQLVVHMGLGRITPYIGDGHPTFNRESFITDIINPYDSADDHPLLYGNNGTLAQVNDGLLG